MTSYVKYYEAQGARVVPLMLNETDDQIYDKLDKLNGVILPGGNADYLEHGRRIFERVLQFND